MSYHGQVTPWGMPRMPLDHWTIAGLPAYLPSRIPSGNNLRFDPVPYKPAWPIQLSAPAGSSSADPGQANVTGPGSPGASPAGPNQLGWSSWGEVASPSYGYWAEGGGGYVYELVDGGDIKIVSGPRNVGAVYPVGSTTHKAIFDEIERLGGWKTGSPGGSRGGGSFWSTISNIAAGTGTGVGTDASSIISAFQSGDKQAATQGIAAAAVAHGPAAAQAIASALGSKGKSYAQLVTAYKMADAKCKAYQKSGNANKAAKWCAKRDGYALQIKQYQASLQASNVPVAAPPPSVPWLPIALGGGALLLIAALATKKKGA